MHPQAIAPSGTPDQQTRERRRALLEDHYTPGFDDLQEETVERWAYVASDRGEHYVATFGTFEDLCTGAGIEVLDYGPDPLALLSRAQDEIADGWVPVEVHDLNTGTSWGIDLLPVFCGPRRPAEALAHATAALDEIADACEYDPDRDGSVDALIGYKDAVEDQLRMAIAAGWSA